MRRWGFMHRNKLTFWGFRGYNGSYPMKFLIPLPDVYQMTVERWLIGYKRLVPKLLIRMYCNVKILFSSHSRAKIDGKFWTNSAPAHIVDNSASAACTLYISDSFTGLEVTKISCECSALTFLLSFQLNYLACQQEQQLSDLFSFLKATES